jgi:hypothetical protein
MASSYNIDSKLDKVLEDLKDNLGASSKAEVLRKAIALLNVAIRHENPDGSVTLRQQDAGNNFTDTKVILR